VSQIKIFHHDQADKCTVGSGDRRVDGLKSLINTAKASGAVKKFLPSAVTGLAVKPDAEEVTDSELEKVEKRFVSLKTALVEKCQSSKM